MEQWNLAAPFEVDDGELDGLPRNLCFTLGVEWSFFYEMLQKGEAFERQVHMENFDRLVRLCEHFEADYDYALHDEWPTIFVYGH